MKLFTYKCPVCGKSVSGLTRKMVVEHIQTHNLGIVISLSALGQDEVYLCTKECAKEYSKYLEGKKLKNFNRYEEAIATLIK